MTSLYEVLKAQKLGAAIAPDYFTALWAGATGGGGSWETVEYTGAVPVEIIAAGEPLIDYLISGNMSQTGTPTPQSIIMPQECGERTGNLFDVSTVVSGTVIGQHMAMSYGSVKASSVTLASDYISVNPAEQYVFSCENYDPANMNGRGYAFYDSNKNVISSNVDTLYDVRVKVSLSITTPSNASYVRISYDKNATKLMLNSGSTPLPYSPYGYKLDISSGDTTVPIYLGEVETERRVKKLVLTGEEASWIKRDSPDNTYQISYPSNAVAYSGMCSHFANGGSRLNNIVSGEAYFGAAGFAARYDTVTTLDAWKTYLQQQYANGTPVCVWYVLATPTTGIVNEPLRKIGDYADTISAEQAGVSIPTVEGANVVDVETTLKPSEIYIKYKGRSSE